MKSRILALLCVFLICTVAYAQETEGVTDTAASGEAPIVESNTDTATVTTTTESGTETAVATTTASGTEAADATTTTASTTTSVTSDATNSDAVTDTADAATTSESASGTTASDATASDTTSSTETSPIKSIKQIVSEQRTIAESEGRTVRQVDDFRNNYKPDPNKDYMAESGLMGQPSYGQPMGPGMGGPMGPGMGPDPYGPPMGPGMGPNMGPMGPFDSDFGGLYQNAPGIEHMYDKYSEMGRGPDMRMDFRPKMGYRVAFTDRVPVEEMIVGKISERIGQYYDVEGLMELCPDAEAMGDRMIEFLETRPDVMEDVCWDIEYTLAHAELDKEDCEMIQEQVPIDCPPTEEGVLRKCIQNTKEQAEMEQQNFVNRIPQMCENEWEQNQLLMDMSCNMDSECEHKVSQFMWECEEQKRRIEEDRQRREWDEQRWKEDFRPEIHHPPEQWQPEPEPWQPEPRHPELGPEPGTGEPWEPGPEWPEPPVDERYPEGPSEPTEPWESEDGTGIPQLPSEPGESPETGGGEPSEPAPSEPSPVTESGGSNVEPAPAPEPAPEQAPAPEPAPAPAPEPAPAAPAPTGEAVMAVGQAAMASGGDCRAKAEDFKRMCYEVRKNEDMMCNHDLFIPQCEERYKTQLNYNGMIENAETMCNQMAKRALIDMDMGCKKMELEYRRCNADTDMRIKKVKEAHQRCTEIVSPESIREFVVKKANYYCRMQKYSVKAREVDMSRLKDDDIFPVTMAVSAEVSDTEIEEIKQHMIDLKETDRDGNMIFFKGITTRDGFHQVSQLTGYVYGIEIDSLSIVGETVGGDAVTQAIYTLEASKDRLSDDYRVWIEHEQGNILEAEESVEELEELEDEKGAVYKFQKLLGFMEQREKQEAEELDDQAAQIQESINSLEELAGQVEDVSVKASIKDQAGLLEQRRENLRQMSEKKRRGAAGLFSMLGGGG